MRGIADLFVSSGSHVDFRMGTLASWNSTTGENTVTVGGSTLTDLPVLQTTALPTLTEGDVVGLLRVRNQFILLGKVEKPPI